MLIKMQVRKTLLVVMLGMMSVSAMAADAATKVVVLDMQRAVMMTEAAREKMKALENQKEYLETHKKAEALRQQLLKKQEELQKEGPTWTVEKRNDQLKDMDFMRKDFELAAQKLQADQQELLRELAKASEPKIKQALDQLIKEQQITLVVDKNAAIFSDRSIDITEALVQKLNGIK